MSPKDDVYSARLVALRAQLEQLGVDGFIVPMAGPHQGDYVPEADRRLTWLTGFSGSAGLGLVTQQDAVLFVDGRYTQQAQEEVDLSLWRISPLQKREPFLWLTTQPDLKRIAYDPWCISVAQHKARYAPCVPLEANPIDELWANERPPQHYNPIRKHSTTYAGLSVEQKLKQVFQGLDTPYILVTAPESVAWLTNTRGSDFPYTPCCACFALADKKTQSITLFLRPTQQPTKPLEPPVHLASFEALFEAFPVEEESRVCIDEQTCPYALAAHLEASGVAIVPHEDPCLTLKAIKNPVEIDGARQAHIWDAVAMIEFLAHLAAEPESFDEVSAAALLDKKRRSHPQCLDLSFPTISAFGEHGSIIHYHPKPGTYTPFQKSGLYLVDSGGQYNAGTTDITRTLAIGEPSSIQKRHFTLVLKGHINLARAQFPKGTTGAQLDALARIFLWQDELDYPHGTGHGVGSCLAVHESPPHISKRGSSCALEAGMIVSNEPGVYLTGQYGIRLESLLLVIERAEGYLGFETLTLVPFDPHLIDWSLIENVEKEWLYQYHRRVYVTLQPYLSLMANRYMETTLWI